MSGIGYFLVSNMADDYILWAEEFPTHRLTEDECSVEYSESLGTFNDFTPLPARIKY